jgi:acyl-CoA thioester hydrolase
MGQIYQQDIEVTAAVVDGNHHVNNVAYVQWMQDVAIAHATSVGGTAATQAVGATWVARSHQITYLKPAYEGDRLRLLTWISNLRKARSLRKYKFLRLDDDTTIATGSTEWVFVDRQTGRPKSVPESVITCFDILPEAAEP